MGRGDQKSTKGKIARGSYGKTRPRKSASVAAIPVKVLKEEKVTKAKASAKPKTDDVVIEKEKAVKTPKTKKTEE